MFNNPVIILSIVSLTITVALTVFCFIRNKSVKTTGFIYLVVTLVSMCVWTLFFIFESLSTDVGTKLLMTKVELMAIMLIPAGFLLLIRSNIGGGKPIHKSIYVILTIIILSGYYLALANPANSYYAKTELVNISEDIAVMKVTYGPSFIIIQSLIYSSLIIGSIYVAYKALRGFIMKRQALFMIAALIIPVCGSLSYVFKLTKLDWSNPLLGFGAACLTFSFMSYGVFDSLTYVRHNILQLLTEAIFIVDENGNITYINKASEKLLDIKLDSVKSQPITSFFSSITYDGEQDFENEIKIQHINGMTLSIVFIPLSKKTGKKLGSLAVITDISEKSKMEEKLRYLTDYDETTGLINSATFIKRINNIELTSENGLEGSALYAIGVANAEIFTGNASTEQRRAVDAFIAETLINIAGSDSIIGRISENEFIIYSDGERFNTEQAMEFFSKNRSVSVVASEQTFKTEFAMGVYLIGKEVNAQEAVNNASFALQLALTEYKSRLVVYDSSISIQHQLQKRVLTADENVNFETDFYLDFQPIIDATRNIIIGAEALLRWKHPVLGRIAPGVFIPMFESSREIYPLGIFVLHQAFMTLKTWEGIVDKDFVMSINISKKQIDDPRFLDDLTALIRYYDVDPKMLDFEFTETATSDDISNLVNFSKRVKAVGATVTMDDFGAGNTSLAYITDLSCDRIKLDIAISQKVHVDLNKGKVMRALLEMCNNLGIDVIVEHVETISALESLLRLGFKNIQGYIYSRPLSKADFINYYDRFGVDNVVRQ